MARQLSGILGARVHSVLAPVLMALVVCGAPVQGAETIGGAIYTDLANPLTTGLAGVTVTVTGSGGTFSADTAGAQGLWSITDVPDGTYTVTPCMAGKKFEHIVGGVSDGQGSIEITVDATPANRQANQSIQFLAGDGVGAPDAGESTVEATSPVDSGAPSTVTITAQDACGNPIPGIPAGEVIVSAPGSPTIVQPTAATNSSGQTTATVSWPEPNLSGYTVSATISGTAVSDTATVVVNTGPPSKLAFTAQPAGSYTAGQEINAIPQVTVQDASGNPVDSSVEITIAIGVNPGGGTLSGTTTRLASGGVAAFPGLSINKIGTGYTLTASASGLTLAESSAFNIVPGDPASLSFVASPGTTPALGVLSPSPRVGVYDNLGNLVGSADVPVTVALTPATANLDGTLTVNAINGVAQFDDLIVGPPGTFPDTFQLTATSGSLTSATSDSFEVTADPALAIEKVDSADPVDPNDEVVYTITYGNDGLGDATNTVIVETLPAELIYVSSTAGGVYAEATKTITWTIGSLAAGTTGEQVSFTARVDPDLMAEGGPVTNSQLTIDCDETAAVQAAGETTTVNDTKEPVITPVVPAATAEEVELDTIVKVHITDGTGVDYDGGTVTIQVEGDLIYDGANETSLGEYDSTGDEQAVRGICRRAGTPTAYTFTFLPSTQFGHEKKVDVAVTATDEAGNSEQANYYFWTQLRSFGANGKVNSDSGTLVQDNPATATDSEGNIWVVWDQTSSAGDTDIYTGALLVDANAFTASAPVAASDNSERKPAIAVDANDTVYVTWAEIDVNDPNGHWDIYVSSSADGADWSTPTKVTVGDPNNTSDQVDPTIAIDRAVPNMIYVAWEDSRDGNKDIWLATSTDGASWSETQVTDAASDQTGPVMGVDANNVAYVVWTDARNQVTSGTDLYGASSEEGWTAVALVTTAGDQSDPAGAVSEVVHLAWTADINGYGEIMYANDANDVLPLVGVSIVDAGEPNAVQRLAALAVHSALETDTVFACWDDGRNVNNNNDTDIYFAESTSPFGTNILVNDDSGTGGQTKPAIGVDQAGNPYMVWVDGRNGNDDIYYAGTTTVTALATNVTDVNGVVTIELPSQPGLHVEIPADAMPDGIDGNDISISEVSNPPAMPASLGGFGLFYDFGPSGLVFDNPITIRMLLVNDPGYSVYKVYRYDPGDLTSPYHPWTEEGISNPATKVTDATGTYLEVEVSHFTIFGVGGYVSRGGGGGGGCALTPRGGTDPADFVAPFVGYALVLLTVTMVDRYRRRSRHATR